jgi:hypothetical protein
MWNFLRDKCIWFYTTFHNNETIVWARLQMALGAAWLAVSNSDLSVFINNPKVLGYWLIANSFISEYLRRRGADFSHNDDKDSKEPA